MLSNAGGSPDFSVELTLDHGDITFDGNSVCQELAYRLVEISDVPTVNLTYSSDPNNISTSLASSNVIPLCDSETRYIEMNCSNCTYEWNTAATTPVINVNSQGGYYGVATNPLKGKYNIFIEF